jgi:hypothetical protein
MQDSGDINLLADDMLVMAMIGVPHEPEPLSLHSDQQVPSHWNVLVRPRKPSLNMWVYAISALVVTFIAISYMFEYI